MDNKQNKFIPEVTINNSKTLKKVVIDGVEQEVEVPAQEGFNIKTKDLEGNYEKKFFLKDLQGVILFDRYQIQSKYNVKDMYFSNEFEFSGPRNNVRVYSPSDKKVLYEGPYAGAKEHFATGQMTIAGSIEKTFDVFSILYFLIDEEVFRFRWKLNQNNNWFSYKDGCRINKEDRTDNHDYRSVLTKFSLDKKKFGSNEFWVCNLQRVEDNDRSFADKISAKLEEELETPETTTNRVVNNSEEIVDDFDVSEIPF